MVNLTNFGAMSSWSQLSVDKQMNLGLMFGRIERPVSKMNHRWSSKKLDGSQQLREKPANPTLSVAFPLLPATETEQR